MNTEWNRVSQRLRELKRFPWLIPTVDAMLWLVASLREDRRLGAVVPNVSLASLTLRLSDSDRYVVVARSDAEPKRFEIFFADPPLEFSETTIVSEDSVVTAIVEYIERLKKRREESVRRA